MLETEKQKGIEAEGAVWAGGWEDGWHVEAVQGAWCGRGRGLTQQSSALRGGEARLRLISGSANPQGSHALPLH